MSDEIFARTCAIIEGVTGPQRTPPNMGPETPLADGSWLDSIELLEVIIGCEAEFGFVFADQGDLDGTALSTLGSLVDLIRNRLSRLPPALP